jgi:hypothetical protein
MKVALDAIDPAATKLVFGGRRFRCGRPPASDSLSIRVEAGGFKCRLIVDDNCFPTFTTAEIADEREVEWCGL